MEDRLDMKKHTRLISLILGITLCVCGCQKTPTNEGEELQTNVNSTGTEKNENQNKLDALRPFAYGNVEGLALEPGSYISVIGRYANDSYWKEVEAGVKRAEKDINSMLGYKGEDKVKISFSAPADRDDIEEQINILDEELARYPIAICIAAIDTTACQTQFDLAAENGIPVITFDSGSDYKDVAAHVSTDNYKAARTAASHLAEFIQAEGDVALFVQDSLSMTAKERERGFLDELAEKYPDIHVASTYHLDELKTMAQQIADAKNALLLAGEEAIDPENITQEDVVTYILNSNPNLKGIFATNLDTTQLVTKVVSSNKAEDLTIIGFDGGEKQLSLLTSDVIHGLIVQNPYGIGYATVVAASRTALGLGNEAIIDSGFTWVTKDNMDQVAVKNMLYK